MTNWVLVTAEAPFGGALRAAQAAGEPVTGVVVGPRALAEQVASAGATRLLWAQTDAVEAAAPLVAEAARAQAPRIVLTSSAPAARALAAAIVAGLDAVAVPGVTAVTANGTGVVAELLSLRGRVLETVQVEAPLIGFFAGDDADVPGGTPVEIEPLDGAPAAITSEAVASASGGAGLESAERVVSVGRGLKSRDDLKLIEQLAGVLDAEIGSSMPVADDLGWVAKDHYVGRSGQHITPRLYLAVGISGAPQHMEGVRGAKVIAAINNDPDARVFRSADYGIVGDLYEVIPALVNEIGK